MARLYSHGPGIPLALGAAAGLGLVAYGYAEHRQASLPSVCAAAGVLVGYALLGFAFRRPKWSAVLKPASIAGLAAGAVYAAEILFEYSYLPRDNVAWGYAEFGLVFLIYALVAGRVSYARGSIGDGVRVALIAAVISADLVPCAAKHLLCL